jgi:hypothetical protein
MLISLWRRLRKNASLSSRGNELSKGRQPTFRPKLEVLEDRSLPTVLAHGILPPVPERAAVFVPPPPQPIEFTPSGALSGLQSSHNLPHHATANQLKMTVAENTRETVIDLCSIFTQRSDIRPDEGLQLSLLGNTNPRLVRPDLSEGELTFTYTPWHSGTATITVGATDIDGSSVQENIFVTVLPLLPTKPEVSTHLHASLYMSMHPETSRNV